MSLFSLIRRQVTPLIVLCCFVFFASRPAQAQYNKLDPGNNNPPPAGAILDLSGTPVTTTFQQYTVNFTAAIPNTAITFAFREDPAFILFSNASVTDLANPGVNLLVNGDFSQGPVGSSTPNGWTYANIFGAAAGGVVVAGCGVGGSNCWDDGAVQAYDAISQTISTIAGHTYQISFFAADTFACGCNYSDLSTNGDILDTGGNGRNVTVYAQAGLPVAGGGPMNGTTTGAQLTINGALNSAAPVPVFATITDSQIHSTVFQTVPTNAGGEDNCTAADQISTDSYVMQGGAPTGCDPGLPFEGSLAQASATVSGFAVTTKYVVWIEGPAVCNTNNTICIGGGNPSNDTGFMTVTNNNTGHNFTGTIGLAGTPLNPSTCLPSGATSDSKTFNADLPFAAGASWTFAISTDASACGGLQPTQVAPPQQIAVGGTNSVQFNAAANNIVLHTLIWANNLTFQNGVTNPQLSSTNIILSTDPTIAPFLKFTPWAVAQLFEKAGDDQAAGGTGFGSLYRDKCFQLGSDPSTATEQNCPVGTRTTDFINFSDTFDQPTPKPDIAPGTTVSLVHHPGTAQTGPQPSDTWAPVPSGATSNPVCTQVQTSGATFSCELEDDLIYDPATISPTSPGGVSGDETTIGGRKIGRGTMASLFKVPMLQTAVKVNTTPVNTIVPGEVQGTQQYWFNSHTLNLDFLVNPAQASSPNNGWFAAPVQNLAYVFYKGTEPALPDPPNCVTTGSTCTVKSGGGTPGAFTGGVAAPVDFIDSLTGVNDGLYTLAWSARDTVQIGERNIQLLHVGSPTPCPSNPYNPLQVINPPCYSTTLFSAQIGVDTVPPAVSCNPTMADGLWHNNDVNFNCNAIDATSGLAAPSAELPNVPFNFNLGTSVPALTETANASTNSQQFCDLAINCVTAGPIMGNMIDKKPPTIMLTVPPANGTGAYAANQVVKAAYVCPDGGSGTATCVGTVPSGSNINTVPNGVSTLKTFTVNSTDKVGNISFPTMVNYTVSCHYAALGIRPSSIKRPRWIAWITVTSSVMDCVPAPQTVQVKFTLSGPLGDHCSTSSTVMFTTRPFTIKSGTSNSTSFPFPIFNNACVGTYTVTTTTLQGTSTLDSTSATLTITN
jgi:hypothetical protein